MVFFANLVHTKQGDDMHKSIWTEHVQMPSFQRLEQDLKTDVLIVGGGLTGILCDHTLAQDGVDYALIEGDRIGRGVSRNTPAKITSQHGLIYGKLIREFGIERNRLRRNQLLLCSAYC